MGFRIAYTKLLTLRCWHPNYLGSVASRVPVAPADTLSVAEKQDYLGYDVRRLLEIRPTPPGQAMLDRYGLLWVPTTLGGWLLGRDDFSSSDPTLSLQLGVFLQNPGFAAQTDFGDGAQVKRLFYLANANHPPAATHDLTAGNLRGIHYVDSSAPVVRLPQLVPGTDSQVEVRDPLRFNNPVLETVPVAGGEPATDQYELDLRHRPAGLYRFTGANISNQNLAVGFNPFPDLIGVIELHLAAWSGSSFDLHFKSSNS